MEADFDFEDEELDIMEYIESKGKTLSFKCMNFNKFCISILSYRNSVGCFQKRILGFTKGFR
jgi:hypothetical protein